MKGRVYELALANLFLLFTCSCGLSPNEGVHREGFEQLQAEPILSLARSYFKKTFQISDERLDRATVYSGSKDDTEAVCRQSACACLSIFHQEFRIVWTDDPNCPYCFDVAHEFTHAASAVKYQDLDYEHERFNYRQIETDICGEE